MKIKHPFVPQPAQFIGHGAAVHGKKIRQLLPVEGNGEGAAVLPFGFVRKVGEQFFSCGALRHVAELLDKALVLVRDRIEHILDQPGVEGAGRGADRQDPPGIEEEDRAFLRGDDIVHQRAAVRHDIGFPEHFSGADLIQDVKVAPVILLLDMESAFRKKHQIPDVLALPERVFALAVLPDLRVQAVQHRADIVVSDAGEQLGSAE